MTHRATSSGHAPQSLLEAGLQPVWVKVRARLDKHGSQRRGAIALPDLDPGSELTLRSLLGKVSKRLDLGRLETALVERGIGNNLNEALAQLGHPPSAEAAQRRAVRARSAAARAALRGTAESWPEPWAGDWADDVVSAGLHGGFDPNDVETLVHDVRRLLDYLDQHAASNSRPAPRPDDGPSNLVGPGTGGSPDQSEPASLAASPFVSRTELAATLFGSAHALDPGTRLAAFVSRALRLRVGEDLTGRELWEAAGIQADRVSAPALVWAIPVTGRSVLAELLRGAAEGGLPLHVSLLALRRDPVIVPAGTQVLVVENPRLVEAASERNLECCVVAANGNPATAVTTLLGHMHSSGASLWYHGDFDAAGIAICRRMRDSGCAPWMMAASDYRDAIRIAQQSGVRLERDTRDCGPTPWDPHLETAFGTGRLIVHEESVLDDVLDGFSLMASRRQSAST